MLGTTQPIMPTLKSTGRLNGIALECLNLVHQNLEIRINRQWLTNGINITIQLIQKKTGKETENPQATNEPQKPGKD